MHNESQSLFYGPRAFHDLSFLIPDLICYSSALCFLHQNHTAFSELRIFLRIASQPYPQLRAFAPAVTSSWDSFPKDICYPFHSFTSLLQGYSLRESFLCHFIKNYKCPLPTLHIIFFSIFFSNQLTLSYFFYIAVISLLLPQCSFHQSQVCSIFFSHPQCLEECLSCCSTIC